MKNLFLYASKEFVQNSFLRWLIENYNCEDKQVSFYARKFISAFMGVESIVESNDITDMGSWAEWKKIDITFEFTYKGKKTAIFIEDKTTSCEHNQLEGYNHTIKAYCESKGIDYYRVYYKTSVLEKDERERVELAQWNVFDQKRILSLFSDSVIEIINNSILKDYVIHIRSLNDYMSIPFFQWRKQSYLSFFTDVLDPLVSSIAKDTSRDLPTYHGIYQGKNIWWVVQFLGTPSFELKIEFNSHGGHSYRNWIYLRFLNKNDPTQEFIDNVATSKCFAYKHRRNAGKFAWPKNEYYDLSLTQSPVEFIKCLRILIKNAALIKN